MNQVFIQTFGDIEEHDRILHRLQKDKVWPLEIVDHEDDADIVLVFGHEEVRKYTPVTTVTRTRRRRHGS